MGAGSRKGKNRPERKRDMKVLITGANGFIGKNLTAALRYGGGPEALLYDTDREKETLARFAAECDFVVHLAGVNRPPAQEDFMTGNAGFTAELLAALEKAGNGCPVLMTSSVQAALDNPYGRSKLAAEELLFAHAERTGAEVFVYRLPNVFGKWCRPQYNSAVATFCYNVARGLPITVTDPAICLTLVYIDDVVEEILRVIRETDAPKEGPDAPAADVPQRKILQVPVSYQATLGRITALLYGFKESRKTLAVADMAEGLEKKLYATYLSYLPPEEFAYDLTVHGDARGSFTEVLRTPERGQVSVNISKPGIIKGEHWHQTKNEKFLVVSGEAVIRLRNIFAEKTEITEHYVSGRQLRVVDIPPGYTHHIENLGDTDLVTLMWASEPFCPERPDTYAEKVRPES